MEAETRLVVDFESYQRTRALACFHNYCPRAAAKTSKSNIHARARTITPLSSFVASRDAQERARACIPHVIVVHSSEHIAFLCKIATSKPWRSSFNGCRRLVAAAIGGATPSQSVTVSNGTRTLLFSSRLLFLLKNFIVRTTRMCTRFYSDLHLYIFFVKLSINIARNFCNFGHSVHR